MPPAPVEPTPEPEKLEPVTEGKTPRFARGLVPSNETDLLFMARAAQKRMRRAEKRKPR